VSSLAQPNGDDHPEAALNHLLCAEALLSQQRFDGAAYLRGYVVECSLKGLWLLEEGAATSGKKLWGTKGHNLSYLNAHSHCVGRRRRSQDCAVFRRGDQEPVVGRYRRVDAGNALPPGDDARR
jgi:hypothetical protein